MNEKRKKIPCDKIATNKVTKFYIDKTIDRNSIAAINCSPVDRRMSETSMPILKYISPGPINHRESPNVEERSARSRNWGHSREIGTHPKVYIRNPLLLCCARKQPDTLETDRPLWTPMLPQRDYLRRTIIYGQLDTLSVNLSQKWNLENIGW